MLHPAKPALLALFLCGCRPCAPSPATSDAPAVDTGASDTGGGTTVTVENATQKTTTVYVTFGSDSVVLPASWTFCAAPLSTFSCTFPLAPKAKQPLPAAGKYLNVTISFDAPATCGNTKAEVNVNNPNWYDVTDVSLVDGFSNFILIDANGTKLVTHGKSQNQKAFGVYPLGCDGCTTRVAPPCGFPSGPSSECKGGTQYKPDVPCQYQGPNKGGGGTIVVALIQPEPA